jgi:hypothetical protein
LESHIYEHTTAPSALGIFSKLAIELRQMVWADLLPGVNTESTPLANISTASSKDPASGQIPRKLAILGTSKTLHHEVADEIYGHAAVFMVSPGYEEWRILSKCGVPLRRFDECEKDAMPLYRFKSLRVDIHPPKSDDLGQFVRIRNQALNLVDFLGVKIMLRDCTGPPDLFKVDINILERKGRNWCRDGSLQQSVTARPEFKYMHDTNDVAQILLPFQSIHLVKNASSIKLPTSVDGFPLVQHCE